MQKVRKYFLIAFLVILVDQAVKLLVKLNMDLNHEFGLIGDVFKIHFTENPGAAFGMTLNNVFSRFGWHISPESGKLILSIFSLVAVVAIGYVLYRMASHRSKLPYFVALIFGGAMGNIIDRVFYGVFFNSINSYEGGLFHGRVVDMFFFDIWSGIVPDSVPILGGTYLSFWPIFNIADSAISIGIVVLLLFQGRFFRKHEEAIQKEAASAESAANPEPTSQLPDEQPLVAEAGD
jgi:signal peptidase II